MGYMRVLDLYLWSCILVLVCLSPWYTIFCFTVQQELLKQVRGTSLLTGFFLRLLLFGLDGGCWCCGGRGGGRCRCELLRRWGCFLPFVFDLWLGCGRSCPRVTGVGLLLAARRLASALATSKTLVLACTTFFRCGCWNPTFLGFFSWIRSLKPCSFRSDLAFFSLACLRSPPLSLLTDLSVVFAVVVLKESFVSVFVVSSRVGLRGHVALLILFIRSINLFFWLYFLFLAVLSTLFLLLSPIFILSCFLCFLGVTGASSSSDSMSLFFMSFL